MQTTANKLSEIRKCVSRPRKIQFVLTVVAIVCNSIFEVISLAAMIPFLSVLSSPQAFMLSSTASRFAPMLGVREASQAVWIVCISFAIITVIGGAVRTVTIIQTSKFTLELGVDLSRAVFERTLYQPYSVQANQNSAIVIANVTQNVAAFIGGILIPAMQFLVSSLTVFGILTTLFIINWKVASTATVVFGGAYLGISHINKSRFARNSATVLASHDQIMKSLHEGLGAIREVVIHGNYQFYTRAYYSAERQLRSAAHDTHIRSTIPKNILEALGMLMICGTAFVLSNGDSSLLSAVPVLGVLAMGAQRLLPSMQALFSSYSSIIANMHGLDRTVGVLRSEQAPQPLAEVIACGVVDQITFDNVEFRYGIECPLVLRKISFKINRGEHIGIIGTTGSGKSTTMDLLLGLLVPTGGQILVDGTPLIGSKVFAWQKSLSHVPQAVYLADVSIAENIAFGLPKDKIDMNQVRNAARLAQIAEHIESLDSGYDTFVGERGIRLSGGQRQRIGIARALYRNATVLVFDEATSALDDETEAELMKAIDGLSKDLTVIMIAHRLSTVRRCDKILKLHKGKVVAFDTPDVVLGPLASP